MRMLFHFGGIGDREGPPLDTLRACYEQPQNSRLFAVAFEAVEAALGRVGAENAAAHLPAGFRFPDLLCGKALAAPVRNSVIEGMCTHLHHLCLLQPHTGRAAERTGGRAVAAVGHSLGLFAALVAAAPIQTRREFLEESARSLLFVALTLLRCHQAWAQVQGVTRPVEPSIVANAAPSPMAGLRGVGLSDLREAVAEHNRVPSRGAVEIALVNSAEHHVLSGAPLSLVRFWATARERWDRPGVKWYFLPNTVPFHSSALSPAMRLLDEDRDFVGELGDGGRLTASVYVASPFTAGALPVNLKDSPDPYRDAAEQLACRPVDWHSTVTGAVRADAPDHLMDFGPGQAARLLTRSCLREAGYEIKYINA